MPGRPIKLKESKYIRDLAEIMASNQGPFTKIMLCELLHKKYPKLYLQELKAVISGAIQSDKYINRRFRLVKPGWWDLAEKKPQPEKAGA
jgi:hypothetical protein